MHMISTNQIDSFFEFQSIIATSDICFKFANTQNLLERQYYQCSVHAQKTLNHQFLQWHI